MTPSYPQRLGILKGWLMAKDAPVTILAIADEVLSKNVDSITETRENTFEDIIEANPEMGAFEVSQRLEELKRDGITPSMIDTPLMEENKLDDRGRKIKRFIPAREFLQSAPGNPPTSEKPLGNFYAPPQSGGAAKSHPIVQAIKKR